MLRESVTYRTVFNADLVNTKRHLDACDLQFSRGVGQEFLCRV